MLYAVSPKIIREAFEYADLHHHYEKTSGLRRLRPTVHRVYACPACLFSTHNEAEWKHHWWKTHIARPASA